MLELPFVFDGIFVSFCQLEVIYDYQATNRSAVGEEGSQEESSLLPIGHLGLIDDSQLHGYVLFITIQIIVKNCPEVFQ